MMHMLFKHRQTARLFLWLFCTFGVICSASGRQNASSSVEKVYVVFKTHLDVGFTDLSSNVTQRYVHEFIPKALDLSEKLAAENSSEKYVWTTGAWLIWKYMQTAAPEDVKRLEAAIERGDIVWNAVPYTVEAEIMNKDLLETCLNLSRRLDRKYHKTTLAAKMTDVPGQTRSIITPMVQAGIQLLHIGVNGASPVPEVPNFCRWRDTNGNELILVYQQNYGTEDLLPGGKTAISVNFTGDNHGPHTYEQVKQIYADLRKRYPNARLIPASFNEIARELAAIRDELPVVTSEIGDTWIYGCASAPIRMAKYRTLANLYSKWVDKGKIDKNSDEALNFALELGLIAEHTQGLDVKSHLQNWDKYDMNSFLAARNESAFKKIERSWKELDAYIDSAITYLPQALQNEAWAAIRKTEQPIVPKFSGKAQPAAREWQESVLGGDIRLEGLSYQMLDSKDYEHFFDTYIREKYGWALADFGKPGLDQEDAVSVTLKANATKEESRKNRKYTSRCYELKIPEQQDIDPRVFPEKIFIEIKDYKNKNRAEITLTILGKPAVRLPEAYWFSINTPNLTKIIGEKIGERIDLLDVVRKGNRQEHAIDRYIDLEGSAGKFRIWSETAFLVRLGEAKGLNYSLNLPDPKDGIHFNLNNNLWGTNYSMWNEGSLSYHFTIQRLD